ncbi:hypothetical protein [Oceaniglobus ichthyenteri]|uniref:hypothetical protein n=1 Tax=Oceaniglobus ichthyenteri TaxID=2136177 RepID=UPI000D3D5113|nr:hypothetical protein [Oceaniglobus ichthyenteri]
MTRQLIASAFVLGGFFLATSHAQAQQNRNCAPRDVVVERLGTTFGETRQSIGLAANNQVVEVFASAESGSWTIVVSTPAGVSCVVAAGQAFENLAERLPASGKPA